MTDPHHSERMRALEERLEAAKAGQGPKTSRGEEHFSQANMAWRMVVELVAGLLIGFGMGYGLDSLFGTTPIMLVLFTGFGFAAGINVMLRTAREIQTQELAKTVGDDDNAGTPADDMRD